MAANNDTQTVETTPAAKEKKPPKYRIEGLVSADVMMVESKGVMYDLAKITDVQAEQLITDGCHYVVKVG